VIDNLDAIHSNRRGGSMNSSAIPALASQMSVSVRGVGSYLPEQRVSNEEILQYLRPARPDGRLLESEWVERHLAIHECRLDLEFGGRRKRSRPDGGTGREFEIDSVARWYLHQANGVVVRKAAEMLRLPPARIPIGVDHYGNTSAASTFILLDKDRRAGRVHDGDLIAFLWIGAGNGAMNGYSGMVL
jgi:3-oxoacyl-[acyl-carrier-protein] synthase III